MATNTASEDAPTRTERGISLARGPALVVGTVLLAAGLYFLYREHNFPPFSNFPNGSAPVPGKAFFGIFGVNGWSGMLTAVAGGLLLFGAAEHLLAKTMSLIVGAALGAAAIIAAISGNVLGMAAANVWTKLLWAGAAAILLINTLVPRRRRQVTAAADDRRLGAEAPAPVTEPSRPARETVREPVAETPSTAAEPAGVSRGAGLPASEAATVADRPAERRQGAVPALQDADYATPGTADETDHPTAPTADETDHPTARTAGESRPEAELMPEAEAAPGPSSPPQSFDAGPASEPYPEAARQPVPGPEPADTDTGAASEPLTEAGDERFASVDPRLRSERYGDSARQDEGPALGATGDPVLEDLDQTPAGAPARPPREGLLRRWMNR